MIEAILVKRFTIQKLYLSATSSIAEKCRYILKTALKSIKTETFH